MNKRVWVHEGETEVAREMIQTVREGERERQSYRETELKVHRQRRVKREGERLRGRGIQTDTEGET